MIYIANEEYSKTGGYDDGLFCLRSTCVPAILEVRGGEYRAAVISELSIGSIQRTGRVMLSTQ